MRQKKSAGRGYTLFELCMTLAALSIVAAIVYPVMNGAIRDRARRASSMVGLHQLGAAMLQYAQDNDQTLPPAYAIETAPANLPSAPTDREPKATHSAHFAPFTAHFWLGQATFSEGSEPNYRLDSGGLLSLHSEKASGADAKTLFGKQIGYMVNDLAGGATLAAFIAPTNSIIATESEDGSPTAGHAIAPRVAQLSPIWNKTKREMAVSAAIDKAAARYNNGANYLLADGHVRRIESEAVFFPSRYSSHRTHIAARTGEAVGPDPSGDMTFSPTERIRERTYSATFHLR